MPAAARAARASSGLSFVADGLNKLGLAKVVEGARDCAYSLQRIPKNKCQTKCLKKGKSKKKDA